MELDSQSLDSDEEVDLSVKGKSFLQHLSKKE
jgi:hypothetical protein